MGVGEKGRGFIVDFLTASATNAISAGDFVELDSSGNIVKCTAAETTKFIGICAVGVRARDTASQQPIAVQTRGLVEVIGLVSDTNGGGTYVTSIVPGERLMVGSESVGATLVGQCMVHATADAGTTGDFNTDGRKPVAIALEGVTGVDTGNTTGSIRVLLTL